MSKHLINKPTRVMLYLPEGIVTRSLQNADGTLNVWIGRPAQIGLKRDRETGELQDTGRHWGNGMWMDEYLTEETEETDSGPIR